MSNPFLGEIRLWSVPFAPKGWSLCNGQTMAVSQYQALFSLLNTTFGGNGTSNFLLPNLQGRTAVGPNGSLPMGAAGGEESHTLSVAEIPGHTHALSAQAANGTIANPNPGRSLGQAVAIGGGSVNNYGTAPPSIPFASDAVGNNAGGQGHENRQPFLALNYCIAITGIYPTRS